jgi:hypothetical protein
MQKVNAKSERDMKTKNPKTNNPNPNKKGIKKVWIWIFGRYPLHLFPFGSNMVPII